MNIENLKVLSAKQDLETLKEKFDSLFPSWPEFLATILSLLIVTLVLGPMVFNAVRNMVHKRQEYIQENINQAEKQNKEAALNFKKTRSELQSAMLNANKVLTEAQLEANEIKKQNLKKAKQEAQKLVLETQEEMKRMKLKFNNESKEAIISIAIEAAQKVIEKEIDQESNQKMIEDFIKRKHGKKIH